MCYINPGTKTGEKDMPQDRDRIQKIFILFSIIGLLFTIVELFLQLSNSSFCHTVGCKIVARHTRFGDWPIILMGIISFMIITLLSFRKDRLSNNIINLILISAIAAEGFFVGYQIFRVEALCLFCLTVFGIFLFLSILRIVMGHIEVISGMVSFILILSLFYLVLPVTKTSCLPQNEQLVLFYKEGCIHCEHILDECQRCAIDVYPLPASRYRDLFKALGIEEVPVLFINRKNDKRILIGEKTIKDYLRQLQKGEIPTWNMGSMTDFFKSLPPEEDACKADKPCEKTIIVK